MAVSRRIRTGITPLLLGQTPTYQGRVGSAGWERRHWEGAFYPEDLPPEWRLGYYSQVFDCVYLSYAEWAGCRDLGPVKH